MVSCANSSDHVTQSLHILYVAFVQWRAWLRCKNYYESCSVFSFHCTFYFLTAG